MRRIRFQLRLMLLFVALCAVVFAWLGARRRLAEVNLRGQIRGLEIQREYAAGRLSDPVERAFWRQSLEENEALIASLRERLGETD